MTPIELYNALIERGTRPIITCYGAPAGTARLELSGKVLANHCAKAANFLCEEVLLDEGDGITIDLPPHWRTLVWHVAALLSGLTDGDDLRVTTPEKAGPEDVAVSLDALALAVPGRTGYDGNGDVLAQPDTLIDHTRSSEVRLEPGSSLHLVDPDASELLGGIVLACRDDGRLVVTDRERAHEESA